MGKLIVRPKPHVLVVDDVAANRELLIAHLASLSYETREAADGVAAWEAIDQNEPDLILLDVDMPRMDGITLCRKLKADPRRRLIPVIIVTASHERDQRLRAIAAGADDYLAKPYDANELFVRTRVLLRERELNVRLDATQDVLFALARAVEARDRYTIYHAERVGSFAREVGTLLGFDRDDVTLLFEGGVLHDLGKIAIPDAVLLKNGPLSEDEMAIMRTHSAAGEEICRSLRSVAYYLPIIRHHHERVDGRGYPDHLAGAAIPVGARIVAVADAWDAMTSDRPYRSGLAADEAMTELRAGAGEQWDAEMVDALLHLLEGGLVGRVTSELIARHGD